jgi:hypothetical protein
MQGEDGLEEEKRGADERKDLGRPAKQPADEAQEQENAQRTEGEHDVAADGIATLEVLNQGGEEEDYEEQLDGQE